MHRARTAMIATLLIVLPLAGCLGGDDAAAAVEDESPNDSGTTFEAPEGRGDILAFEETNQTEEGAGGVDHHHDYWEGRERVTIFETSAAMEPFPDDNNRAYAIFRPPQGTFVYERTATVDFTITNPRRHACEGLVTFGGHYYCTDYLGNGRPSVPPVEDPNPPTGLTLRYKHAATVEWIDAGEIAWDAPLSIKITNPVQTDMPHATSSVWEFMVISPNAHDTTLVFDAKADIVRGQGDVPLWPGHPLFYDENRTARVVVNGVSAAACDTDGCTLASKDTAAIPAERIVSYGTRSLFVWVNVTSLQAQNPATAPSAWFLYHNNATGRTNITDPYDFETYGIEKRELAWVLPVDDNGMDSPYADGSRWSFALGASFTSPEIPQYGQLSCYGGCASWYAEYTITVIASSVELPADQYHMFCLDPNSYCGEEGDDAGEEDAPTVATAAELRARGVAL